MKKKALKTVRRVLYPTGSMQQLLNGRAVLSGLYTRGRRISFCALREEKKTLYYRHLKMLFQTQPTRLSSAFKYANDLH